MPSGRVFQARGPATMKAQLPIVESLTGDITKRVVPVECEVRWPGRSADYAMPIVASSQLLSS